LYSPTKSKVVPIDPRYNKPELNYWEFSGLVFDNIILYFQGKKIPENAMTMHHMQKSHPKFQECKINSLFHHVRSRI
jgi:hypothetical protein